VFKRVRRLDKAAHGSSSRHEELTNDLRALVDQWPARVLNDEQVIDITKYVRSPVGWGRPRINTQENDWEIARDDLMGFVGVYGDADVDEIKKKPREDRPGFVVSRIRQMTQPSDEQVEQFFETVNQALRDGSLVRGLARLEHTYRSLLAPPRAPEVPYVAPRPPAIKYRIVPHTGNVPFLLQEKIRHEGFHEILPFGSGPTQGAYDEWVVIGGGQTPDEIVKDLVQSHHVDPRTVQVV
jgi:hypothetical protein